MRLPSGRVAAAVMLLALPGLDAASPRQRPGEPNAERLPFYRLEAWATASCLERPLGGDWSRRMGGCEASCKEGVGHLAGLDGGSCSLDALDTATQQAIRARYACETRHLTDGGVRWFDGLCLWTCVDAASVGAAFGQVTSGNLRTAALLDGGECPSIRALLEDLGDYPTSSPP